MFPVVNLPQQLVGGVTAAFVLLCHVYCACGGSPEAAFRSGAAGQTVKQPVAQPAESHAHCHGHRGHEKAEQPEENPCKSEDDPTCRHCKQIVAAEFGGNASAPLGPSDGLAIFLPSSPPLRIIASPFEQLRLNAGNHLPPISCCSLLRLHCALNT